MLERKFQHKLIKSHHCIQCPRVQPAAKESTQLAVPQAPKQTNYDRVVYQECVEKEVLQIPRECVQAQQGSRIQRFRADDVFHLLWGDKVYGLMKFSISHEPTNNPQLRGWWYFSISHETIEFSGVKILWVDRKQKDPIIHNRTSSGQIFPWQRYQGIIPWRLHRPIQCNQKVDRLKQNKVQFETMDLPNRFLLGLHKEMFGQLVAEWIESDAVPEMYRTKIRRQRLCTGIETKLQ